MKPHTWVLEEVDGGPVGTADFWKCSSCGACGGLAWPTADGYKPKNDKWIFLADGSGLELTEDCEESAALIADHRARRSTLDD